MTYSSFFPGHLLSRNFANKVWNASRFIMMNDPDNKIKATDERPANLTDADKWILSKM